MPESRIHKTLTYFIAAVWLINGLVCKVLDLVPRHRQIVGAIVGDEYSKPITLVIGVLEVGMAIWIISRITPRLNAAVQIMVIAAMNIIEALLVPDLLLWGEANALFAFTFIVLIWYNEFHLGSRMTQQT